MDQPIVGDPPTYTIAENEVPWILGTQLTTRSGPLARAPEGSQVLMIEAHDFARRMPYHHHKLTLVFAGMRRFRDRLRGEGYDVTYIKADRFGAGLTEFFADHPETTLVSMRSPSYRSAERFRELIEEAGGDVRFVDNELFVSTKAAFDGWADADPSETTESFRHEQFYRWMRHESGVLMTGDDPVGGEWNYDDENQEFPPDDWDAPPVLDHDYADTTVETAAWVTEEFDTWGSTEMGEFPWPVTRRQACRQLEHFITERLPEFGPYQDAMRSEEWAMSHALVGAAINLGLLHPVEVIQQIETAHEQDGVAINSVEGSIRQILGWREFMRHVYRHAMPELTTTNQLDATHDLPDLYWTGDTDMECLSETVDDVHTRGYSHHIQRLMVLANFATLWGVEPTELNDWFHATYVDAYHWVTTPNVVEMGQYGHGVFATKPYVSSANYIDRMSDYCSDCHYFKTKDTGDRACPFNALYWDFLDRNEELLRSNHRMGLMYSHVDNKQESGDMDDIRDRVTDLREMAADGDL
jgi:deoxyribodipyrimidine photolyase-related protein